MYNTIAALVGSIIGVALFLGGFLLGLRLKPEPKIIEKHILPPPANAAPSIPIVTAPPPPAPVKPAPPKMPDSGRFMLNSPSRLSKTEREETQRMGELLDREPEL